MDSADYRAQGGGSSLSPDTSDGDAGGGSSSSSTKIASIMDLFECEAQHSLTYEMNETDCVVSNVGVDFELYVTMSAAMDLGDIVASCNRLLRSIKRDEQWLFLTTPVTWTS